MPPKLATLIAIAAVALVGVVAAMFAWDASRDDVIANDVRVGPVDVGGMTRARGARRDHRAPARRRCTSRSSSRPPAGPSRSPRARRASRANVDAMVDARRAAQPRGRRAGPHLARDQRQRRRRARHARDRLLAPRRAAHRRPRARRGQPPGEGREGRTSRPPTSRSARRRSAARSTPRKLRADIAARARLGDRASAPSPPRSSASSRRSRARSSPHEYPVVAHGRPRRLPAQPLQGAQARAGLPDRRRPGRPGDAGRPLQDPEQGDQPGLARAQLALGGHRWPARSSPAARRSNPIKARWLGVYDGVGVHGTDARGSIGTNASHGCIRMLIEDVEKLYDEVPVGTPIFIH